MNPATFPRRPDIAVPCGCTLGEGPCWDARSGTLFWVDILERRLWRWRPGSDDPAIAIGCPDKVCFAKLLAEEDAVLLGMRRGIARLSLPDGGLSGWFEPEPDQPGNRMNDAGVAPDGSLLFGTMDDAEKEPSGSFYRWSPEGLTRFGGHAVVTNGPCLDGARGLVYATDTARGRVYRHRLGPDGMPGEPEEFVSFPSGHGYPDGMAVDEEGCVWICHFGGGRVTRFSPEGEAILVVPMPTAQVTMLAFGGPDLATAYVTSAARGRDRETDPHAGHLFAFDPGVRGQPTAICRMTP